jgi:hypothetical protein
MATGFYPDGSVQTLMSRRHMNSDFPQGIDANISGISSCSFLLT